MAADKRVNVIVAGDSSGAQKALQDVGDKAESSAKRAGSAFSTVAQTLTGAGGGAFSAVSETLEGVSRGIDVVGEHGHSAGAKLLGLGAAGVAAGTMLMTAASDDIQAHQQLEQAIQNTGDTIDDFSGRIDALDGHFQNFGYASETTEQALRVLVQSTGDTGKAIDTMGVAADLAAAKHEDLTTAATQLSVILGGKGGRTLQQFGINLDEFKGKSDAGALAVQALADKLQGQAAAASDTFTGKLQAAKAKIEDFVGEVGQSYGPAITGIASVSRWPVEPRKVPAPSCRRFGGRPRRPLPLPKHCQSLRGKRRSRARRWLSPRIRLSARSASLWVWRRPVSRRSPCCAAATTRLPLPPRRWGTRSGRRRLVSTCRRRPLTLLLTLTSITATCCRRPPRM
jgi:hypothetical protein